MQVELVIISGLWLMLPSLIPNSAAVLFGGGTPIDFGRSWRGKRILGDGKTWRGFIGGSAAGIAVGFLQIMAADGLGLDDIWSFGTFPSNALIVALLAIGALLGDVAGSVVKRRMGIGRGRKAPFLDQFTFLAGSILLVLIFFPSWFIENFIQGEHIIALITILIATPLLHRGVNIIGYKMGKKQVPW